MSALLDILAFVDPVRRRDCEANDAALLELSMKHITRSRASRAWADMAARGTVPAGQDSEFHITVFRHGHPDDTYTGHFPSRLDAYLHAIDKAGPGAVVDVNLAGWVQQTLQGAL